jgi:hypothetical protein
MSVQRPDAARRISASLQLVRAAATLRWQRPDLTVTLAELALDAADDAATWVAAAGWLLHGRNVLGDGRQIACDLLDGLGRWGDAGAELMAGPQGRRLRVELAGPARRTGEQAVARALLAARAGTDALDGELRADVLTELARCAADETPDTADAALDAAEQAWRAAGCEPGVASVLLVRAARDRRAGRADDAATAALAGLSRVNASGRRAGDTDSEHLAAALTAEWIAALVDAGRLDEARSEAVPAANRLLTATRPSRQLAGLRLAVARVAATSESADTVLAALEPAAQDAADGDVPELEAACRSMLGELHEAAGRLEAALTAVRAAMAAERCDHDRGARLRTRLAAVASWAACPSEHATAAYGAPAVLADVTPGPAADSSGPDPFGPRGPADDGTGVGEPGLRGTGPGESGSPDPPFDPEADPESNRAARFHPRAGRWSGATGPGRRARRLAAEDAAERSWSDAPLPELGGAVPARRDSDQPGPGTTAQPAPETAENWFADDTATLRAAPSRGAGGRGPGGDAAANRPHGTATAGRPALTGSRTTDTGRAVAIGAASGGGSLIGDALLRELIESPGPGRGRAASTEEPRPSAPEQNGGSGHVADTGVADTVVFELDPRHDSTVAVPPVRPARDVGDSGAPGRHRPGHGPAAAEAPSRLGEGPQPVVRREPAGGPEETVTGAVHGPGGADTIRVASRVEHDRADTARGPAPNGRAVARDRTGPGGAEAPHTGGGPQDDRRPHGPRRPSAADTDGLGIGDLLAGALAAYRGI